MLRNAMNFCDRLRVVALACALTAFAAPASAQVNAREPDPSVWLRQIYDAYHRAEKSTSMNNGPDVGLIVKRASKSLAALFSKEDACVKKSGEICALDWDFVIDGQDWEISNVKVGAPVIDGDKATVTATFRNFKSPCVNVYFFVREDGVWKVDEIETKSGKDKPIRIGKLLKDYDYGK
jgi:hypothetical protein